MSAKSSEIRLIRVIRVLYYSDFNASSLVVGRLSVIRQNFDYLYALQKQVLPVITLIIVHFAFY